MTIKLELPDELYQRVLDIAARQNVSAERIAAAALAEQLAQWTRLEAMAERSSRERFLAALDKVSDTEPSPEERL